MKNGKYGVWMALPIVLGMAAVHFRILVLIPAAIVLMFVLVAMLPFAHRHENLWLFLICAAVSFPINLFFMTEYPGWIYLLCFDPDVKFASALVTIEVMLVLMGVEEVITGFIGRLIWRRQYKLDIPEGEDE